MTVSLEPQADITGVRAEQLSRMPTIINLGARAVAACARLVREPASNKVAEAMVISARAQARVYAQAVRNTRLQE